MKQTKSIFAAALLLFVASSAPAQNRNYWKEKSEFHNVMSQTFHPMEEGNYKPIRERSAEMLEKAIAWQKSPIPSNYKKVKGIKKTLTELVDESQELDTKIKNNCSDEEIKEELAELHNLFHEIVGLCKTD